MPDLGPARVNPQRRAARDVRRRALSVRDTELLVKRLLGPPIERQPPPPPDVHTKAAEERLRVALGTPVEIVRRGHGGRIVVHFTSENELQRLFEQLTDQ